MSDSSPPAVPVPAPRQSLTVADLMAYERRYPMRHRFFTPESARHATGQTVVEGRVDECRPGHGFQIVGSDLTVYHTYEAHARPDAPAHLSVIAMFEGLAELDLGGQRRSLAAGDAVLVAYDGQQTFRARHVAQPRVRAINVTVTANAVVRDPRLASLIPKVERPAGFEPVHPGPGLWQSLADWLRGAQDGADALLAEGLALQLLARGARGGQCAIPASQAPLSRRDRQLVMRVRARLERHPGETHSLAALAALACMSPSTLRDKFRLAYGCPVFEYLRECRLERARQHLRAGLSVQQAAIRVGYRHPSNFATAFRRRYGYSPREEI